MCGIVGIIAKYSSGLQYSARPLFTNMLKFDSIRGPDSTGVFGVDKNGKVDMMKGDGDGYSFISASNYEKFEQRIFSDYHIVVGHNRKATKGAVSAHNAHPFKEEHIILVHNGTIHNQEDLNKEVEVDSHAIAHALAKHNAVEALEKLHGAFALVWYDQKDKTLSLARNDERPLFLIEYGDFWVISSEAGLPLWLMGRESKKHTTIRQVPTEKILTFTLGKLIDGPKEIEYDEYEEWKPPLHQQQQGQNWQYPTEHQRRYGGYPHRQQSSAALLGPPKQNITSIFKPGDRLTFNLMTYSEEDSEDQLLIGNPLFEKDVDTNMIVRCHLPKGKTVLEFLNTGSKLFTAEVTAMTTRCGVPIIFCREPVAISLISDMKGEKHSKEKLEEAIKKPCGKCQTPITLEQVSQSIVKEKGNGDWRIMCPACLADSLKDANTRQPNLHLVQ